MREPCSDHRRESYSTELGQELATRIIGQPAAIDAIVPFVQMYEVGLAPEGRPAGVFLSLGPTGTGKTKTVEALAAALHGNEKSLLRIDCAEFQMEHEVAKLIGAPPGYLGHRETHPMISQQKLQAATSDHCDLSIVLFDEIEKAAPSLCRLLLGVLDQGILHLGDNTSVNFENSLVFLTSNLGARSIQKQLRADFGFQSAPSASGERRPARLGRAALAAVRKHFAPEFVNRIDSVITYEPLQEASLSLILDQQIDQLQEHIDRRLGDRGFELVVTEDGRNWLLCAGTSVEYGARELKRAVQRSVAQPLAARVAVGDVPPGSVVTVLPDGESRKLKFLVKRGACDEIRRELGRRRELRLTA